MISEICIRMVDIIQLTIVRNVRNCDIYFVAGIVSIVRITNNMNYKIELKLPSEGTWKPVATFTNEAQAKEVFKDRRDSFQSHASPKSDSEFDVLIEIAGRREWVRSYRIVRA